MPAYPRTLVSTIDGCCGENNHRRSLRVVFSVVFRVVFVADVGFEYVISIGVGGRHPALSRPQADSPSPSDSFDDGAASSVTPCAATLLAVVAGPVPEVCRALHLSEVFPPCSLQLVDTPNVRKKKYGVTRGNFNSCVTLSSVLNIRRYNYDLSPSSSILYCVPLFQRIIQTIPPHPNSNPHSKILYYVVFIIARRNN